MQSSGNWAKNLLHGLKKKMFSALLLLTGLLPDIQEAKLHQSTRNLDMKIMFWTQARSLDSG